MASSFYEHIPPGMMRNSLPIGIKLKWPEAMTAQDFQPSDETHRIAQILRDVPLKGASSA